MKTKYFYYFNVEARSKFLGFKLMRLRNEIKNSTVYRALYLTIAPVNGTVYPTKINPVTATENIKSKKGELGKYFILFFANSKQAIIAIRTNIFSIKANK